jgi:hypothetical protein
MKKSQQRRNQGFSYYFCSMIEGSGSLSLTSGSGSRRPKNIRILRILIRICNTDLTGIVSTLFKTFRIRIYNFSYRTMDWTQLNTYALSIETWSLLSYRHPTSITRLLIKTVSSHVLFKQTRTQTTWLPPSWNEGKFFLVFLVCSVPDPWHFETHPDPWLRIRILLCSLVVFKMQTKNIFNHSSKIAIH